MRRRNGAYSFPLRLRDSAENFDERVLPSCGRVDEDEVDESEILERASGDRRERRVIVLESMAQSWTREAR
jgi:hypothetical protein